MITKEQIDKSAHEDKNEQDGFQLIKKFKVNWYFLIFYTFTICANGINVAWTTGGNNQTASIFSAKLDWNPEETRLYNSLINLAS